MNLNSHRNHHPQNIPIDLQHTNIKHLRQHVKKYVVSKNVSHIRDIRYSHIRDICPYKVTYINSLSDQHWIFRNWCPIRWNMNVYIGYPTSLNHMTYVKVTHDIPFLDKQCYMLASHIHVFCVGWPSIASSSSFLSVFSPSDE